jgi:hypothetical protein
MGKFWRYLQAKVSVCDWLGYNANVSSELQHHKVWNCAQLNSYKQKQPVIFLKLHQFPVQTSAIFMQDYFDNNFQPAFVTMQYRAKPASISV